MPRSTETITAMQTMTNLFGEEVPVPTRADLIRDGLVPHESVPLNHVFDVPENVQKCPYCDAPLRATASGWDEDEHGWKAATLEVDCTEEPDIDSDEWEDHNASHSDMPYVYWLPAEIKVMEWINSQYRFTDA